MFYDKDHDEECKDHPNHWVNLNGNLKICQRIGSDSINGFVYQTMLSTLNGDRFMAALKIIPLTIGFPLEKAMHEVTLAHRLSHEEPFRTTVPTVYGYGTMDLEDSPSTDELYESMRLYSLYYYAQRSNASKRALIGIRRMKSVDDHPPINAEEIDGLRQQWLAKKIVPQCVFLVSELADGDFCQLLKNHASTNQWKSIFTQFLAMIRIFFSTYVHGDFHVGNLLYSHNKTNNTYRLMIHDFDTTERLDTLSSVSQQNERVYTDLSNFLDKSLRRCVETSDHPLFDFYTHVIASWKEQEGTSSDSILDRFEHIVTHNLHRIPDPPHHRPLKEQVRQQITVSGQ